jgi:hypothetical protein
MSAWGLARREQTDAAFAAATAGRRRFEFGYVDRVIEWIPGDVLALFGFAVTALHYEGSQPSVALLIAFTVLTPIVVWLGAFAHHAVTKRDAAEIALAMPAFLIWSVAIPESGWWRWHTIAEHSVRTAIAAAVAALLFNLFAQGIERKVPAAPIKRRSRNVGPSRQ